MSKKPVSGPLIGYARVSTQGQDLAQQRAMLSAAGCSRVFEEKVSGAKREADTTTPAGRMVLTVFAGIADFERSLIVERTSAGRIAAKARGVRFGPHPSLGTEQIAHARQLIQQADKTVAEVAKLLGVHRSTLYRALDNLDHGKPQLAGRRRTPAKHPFRESRSEMSARWPTIMVGSLN